MENLIRASGPSLTPNFYGLTKINEIPPQHRANCLLSGPKEKRAQCAQSGFFPIPGGAGGWICPFSLVINKKGRSAPLLPINV